MYLIEKERVRTPLSAVTAKVEERECPLEPALGPAVPQWELAKCGASGLTGAGIYLIYPTNTPAIPYPWSFRSQFAQQSSGFRPLCWFQVSV